MALEAQNNPFTSVLMVGAADPEALPDADPSAGSYRFVIDDTGAAWIVDDAGVATAVGGGGSHAASHEDGGADEIDVTGLVGAGGSLTHVGCQLRNSTTQSIAHDTVTAITMDTETWDTDGYHTGSSANMVIPSGKAGRYLCVGGTRIAGHATGSRNLAIGVNGTRMPNQVEFGDASVGVLMDAQVSAIVNVAVSDTIQLLVYQNSGTSLDVGHASAAFVQSNLTITYLGA